MDNVKWQRYLRVPEEHPATSEQPDNMKHWGKFMLPYKRVLDVGAGTGMLVDWLQKRKINAVGVTICRAEINKGKRNYGNQLRLDLGDMHELPYSDNTIDAIHCKDTFEHAIAPYIALCEFNRVLVKGGLCMIVLPGEEWIECDYHYSWLYPRQMNEMFKKCRFNVKDTRTEKPPVGGTTFTTYFAHKLGDIKWPN